MARYKSERDRTLDDGKEQILSVISRTGWDVEWRNPSAPQYQLAKIDGPGFSLIAYPHKTSAGNHHIRLRDQGSKDKEAYRRAVEEFYVSTGNNCSFQTKDASSVISPEAFLRAVKHEQ